ncbi:hypothetical protein CARUB_v10011948mg [Capsella rubella]|uniref:CCT domain-containing protein n=1 Tax=Capsella rubella TaxID=81985 RepID=R0I337_9BRAS|nr:zinc finger protein CONSTANS-LIKE 12 [Capsella rubella]EOA36659.1 hypothetical protein CARUB_v10011948mg [Capsella rubella]
MGSPLCDHLVRLCLQCDWRLHYETVKSHDDSRIPLCNNCVSQTAVVQCLDRGLCLCQTCFLNPNIFSRFCILQDGGSSYNSQYSCLDFDSSNSSSSSSSVLDRNSPLSYGSLPLINEDSSSSFEFFQSNIDNYTKNSYSDQQVPMLRPHSLNIPKDSSCSGFNSYETKEYIDNVLLNAFDGDEAVLLDLKEYNPNEDLILNDQLIDELTKHNPESTSTKIISSSSSGMSSVIHKDYSIGALANASSQDYYINQMNGSKAKEETNDVAIFPNALVQLDCGQSQLILTDEMLPWENRRRVQRYTPEAREEAKKRYFEKKKKRKFGKQIRYESRKSTADTKRRMKGRFTKADAEYDYDPRANNVKKRTNKNHELMIDQAQF